MRINGNAPLTDLLNEKDSFSRKNSFRKIFSNLYFELGPRYNRDQQINVAQKLYEENILKKHQISKQQKKKTKTQLANRIVNEMNDIYGKMTSSFVRLQRNSPFNFSLHEKYNELVSKINSPQSNFFTTELVTTQGQRHNKDISRLDSFNKHDKNMSCCTDFKFDDLVYHEKQPTVILLKGKNKSRRNQDNGPMTNKYNSIDFNEIKHILPYSYEKQFKEGLKKYELQDRYLANKKPKFKH